MINEKVLSEAIREYFKNLIEQGLQEVEILKCNAELQKLIEEQLRVGEWIPFKEREADPEERMTYGCDMILDCKLPDEDEEILVTYANGTVRQDIFERDGYECYLDSGAEFVIEAVAWQPLPEPYKVNISPQDIAVESSSSWKDHVMQRFTRSE